MGSMPSVPIPVSQPAVPCGSGDQPEGAGTPLESAAAQSVRKLTGYGLPCAKCRTYYWADLKTCPVCKGSERVAAVAAKVRAKVSPAKPSPDPSVPKEQLASSHTCPPTPAFSRCVREENHQGGFAPAAICEDCYEHVQESVLEAALHMDLKEAARIVYDAVWADRSDPSKTYEHAAHALLGELRKRHGTTPSLTLLGTLATISSRLSSR